MGLHKLSTTSAAFEILPALGLDPPLLSAQTKSGSPIYCLKLSCGTAYHQIWTSKIPDGDAHWNLFSPKRYQFLHNTFILVIS